MVYNERKEKKRNAAISIIKNAKGHAKWLLDAVQKPQGEGISHDQMLQTLMASLICFRGKIEFHEIVFSMWNKNLRQRWLLNYMEY